MTVADDASRKRLHGEGVGKTDNHGISDDYIGILDDNGISDTVGVTENDNQPDEAKVFISDENVGHRKRRHRHRTDEIRIIAHRHHNHESDELTEHHHPPPHPHPPPDISSYEDFADDELEEDFEDPSPLTILEPLTPGFPPGLEALSLVAESPGVSDSADSEVMVYSADSEVMVDSEVMADSVTR